MQNPLRKSDGARRARVGRAAFAFAAALFASPGISTAATILSTDFTGRTVSGATASNIPWVLNGVADPGDLTVGFGIFDTPDTQGLFAVDRQLRVDTGGPWSVDIPLNVQDGALALSLLSLDVFAFTNTGAFQSVNREVDLGFAILDSTSATIGSGFANNVQNTTASASGPWSVSFDVSALTLAASEAYTLQLTFSQNSGQTAGNGNQAGFDNLQLTGGAPSTVPLPAGLPLALTGIAALGLLGRLRRARSG